MPVAPELRPTSTTDRARTRSVPSWPDDRAAAWLIGATLEGRATGYAIERLARSHLAEVRERTLDRMSGPGARSTHA